MNDYDEPHTLQSAFHAGDRVLLISSDEGGELRTAQHTAVIDAAQAAGVALLAYTSVLAAPTATFSIGEDHYATEQIILASGLPYVLLHNGWYNENYTGHLEAILEYGRVFGGAGEGRVAAARVDYAAATPIVLTGEGHDDAVYEFSGDVAWSLAEFAAEVARQTGRDITYPSLTGEQYHVSMVGEGVPSHDADALVDADAEIVRGELVHTPGDLSRLIGRPTTPIADSIRAALIRLRMEGGSA